MSIKIDPKQRLNKMFLLGCKFTINKMGVKQKNGEIKKEKTIVEELSFTKTGQETFRIDDLEPLR